jgi:hypothetical protein
VYVIAFTTLILWLVTRHEATVGNGVAKVTVHPVAVAPVVTSPQLLFPTTVGEVPQLDIVGGVLVEVTVPNTLRADTAVVVPTPTNPFAATYKAVEVPAPEVDDATENSGAVALLVVLKISNLAVGVVVPIPTFPAPVSLITSVDN